MATQAATHEEFADEDGEAWGNLGMLWGIHVVLLTPGIGLDLTEEVAATKLALTTGDEEEAQIR